MSDSGFTVEDWLAGKFRPDNLQARMAEIEAEEGGEEGALNGGTRSYKRRLRRQERRGVQSDQSIAKQIALERLKGLQAKNNARSKRGEPLLKLGSGRIKELRMRVIPTVSDAGLIIADHREAGKDVRRDAAARRVREQDAVLADDLLKAAREANTSASD